MKDGEYNVVFVSRPADAPAHVNAAVLGALGTVPDLARRLGVDVETVTLSIRTVNGQSASARLERKALR